MNTKKLMLIIFIFCIASAGWLFLGKTITDRSDKSETDNAKEVDLRYGPPLMQAAPTITSASAGRQSAAPPDRSNIEVVFDHEVRYMGLIWYSLYRVDFDATYELAAPPADGQPRSVTFDMTLPGNTILSDLRVEINGQAQHLTSARVRYTAELQPGDRPLVVRVTYATRGRDAWHYAPGETLTEFNLTMRTDFEDVDYSNGGMSPDEDRSWTSPEGEPGRELVWSEQNQRLLARNQSIRMVMPSRPPAGQLAARISTFAPVSLFFFLTVMITIQMIRNLKIHPMNYLLVAAGFFAFHILLAYLVDHLPIHLSFWIAAAVSVFLVVSYLRLVLGAKAAILFAGMAQMIYLVFFSYAFFWEGWTGLTVVIGAVITLFVIMQLTGRIDWDEKFPDLLTRSRREESFNWQREQPMPATPIDVDPIDEQEPPPESQGD